MVRQTYDKRFTSLNGEKLIVSSCKAGTVDSFNIYGGNIVKDEENKLLKECEVTGIKINDNLIDLPKFPYIYGNTVVMKDGKICRPQEGAELVNTVKSTDPSLPELGCIYSVYLLGLINSTYKNNKIESNVNICDYIDIVNKKLVLYTNQITLTGEKCKDYIDYVYWGVRNSKKYYGIYINIVNMGEKAPLNYSGGNSIISNIFESKYTYSDFGRGAFSANTNYILISIEEEKLEDTSSNEKVIESMLKYLNNNPLVIRYILDQPEEIELTDEQLQSYMSNAQNITLNKLNNIEDSLSYNNGKLVYTKRIGKYIPNPYEYIMLSNNGIVQSDRLNNIDSNLYNVKRYRTQYNINLKKYNGNNEDFKNIISNIYDYESCNNLNYIKNNRATDEENYKELDTRHFSIYFSNPFPTIMIWELLTNMGIERTDDAHKSYNNYLLKLLSEGSAPVTFLYELDEPEVYEIPFTSNLLKSVNGSNSVEVECATDVKISAFGIDIKTNEKRLLDDSVLKTNEDWDSLKKGELFFDKERNDIAIVTDHDKLNTKSNPIIVIPGTNENYNYYGDIIKDIDLNEVKNLDINNIKDVKYSTFFCAILFKNGTVRIIGQFSNKEKVSKWTNVKEIYTGHYRIFAVTYDDKLLSAEGSAEGKDQDIPARWNYNGVKFFATNSANSLLIDKDNNIFTENNFTYWDFYKFYPEVFELLSTNITKIDRLQTYSDGIMFAILKDSTALVLPTGYNASNDNTKYQNYINKLRNICSKGDIKYIYNSWDVTVILQGNKLLYIHESDPTADFEIDSVKNVVCPIISMIMYIDINNQFKTKQMSLNNEVCNRFVDMYKNKYQKDDIIIRTNYTIQGITVLRKNNSKTSYDMVKEQLGDTIKNLVPGEEDISSKIYGIRVDLNNTDPFAGCTYTDDAFNMIPMSVYGTDNEELSMGSWTENFIQKLIGCRPCLMKENIDPKYTKPGIHGEVLYNNKVSNDIKQKIKNIETTGNLLSISSNMSDVVVLKKDGTCEVISGNIDKSVISTWKNIIDISVGGTSGSATFVIGLKNDGTCVATGSNTYGQCNITNWSNIRQISAGDYFTIGLKNNGTCIGIGRDDNKQSSDVSKWTNIKQISAGGGHTVGLKNDGTCVAVGNNNHNQCNVTNESNIIKISASWGNTVLLRANGTCLTLGVNDNNECDTLSWTNLKDVYSTVYTTFGIKQDGTIVSTGVFNIDIDGLKNIKALSTGYCSSLIFAIRDEVNNKKTVVMGDNDYGVFESQYWQNIKQITCGDFHVVGLKEDGTCVASGNNDYGQCNVQDWKNIKQVAPGFRHTVGLKEDGTCIAIGYNDFGQCSVQNWSNIKQVVCGDYVTIGLKEDGSCVATGILNVQAESTLDEVLSWKNIKQLFISDAHVVGLKEDGTCVASGNNDYGQCNVQDWKNIKQVTPGFRHTVGLKEDGTCIAIGNNDCGQCNVQDWKDVVYICASDTFTLGLKKDGTVLYTGVIYAGYPDIEAVVIEQISKFHNICQISAGNSFIIALQEITSVEKAGYLDPNDYTKFIDGSLSPINEKTAINNDNVEELGRYSVMIEFDKLYYFVEYDKTNNLLYIKFSRTKHDNQWKVHPAFIKCKNGYEYEVDHIYISAYYANYYDMNIFNSLKLNTINATIGNHILLVGENYDEFISKFRTSTYNPIHYNDLSLLLDLLRLFAKTYNISSFLLYPYLNKDSSLTNKYRIASMCDTYNKGLFWKGYSENVSDLEKGWYTKKKLGCTKLFGIDNFFGNLVTIVEGLKYKLSNRNFYYNKSLDNDSVFDDLLYTYTDSFYNNNAYGYFTKIFINKDKVVIHSTIELNKNYINYIKTGFTIGLNNTSDCIFNVFLFDKDCGSFTLQYTDRNYKNNTVYGQGIYIPTSYFTYK